MYLYTKHKKYIYVYLVFLYKTQFIYWIGLFMNWSKKIHVYMLRSGE